MKLLLLYIRLIALIMGDRMQLLPYTQHLESSSLYYYILFIYFVDMCRTVVYNCHFKHMKTFLNVCKYI